MIEYICRDSPDKGFPHRFQYIAQNPEGGELCVYCGKSFKEIYKMTSGLNKELYQEQHHGDVETERLRVAAVAMATHNKEFAVHLLNDDGIKKAREIQNTFDFCLNALSLSCPESREFSICKTKLEEACFFAKKAMAQANCK